MTIVNLSKNSNGPSLPKKSYSTGNGRRTFLSYLFTMISASLLVTYIEIWLITQNYYIFLTRPFPNVFPIDIRFTLLVIPAFTLFALWVMKSVSGLTRFVFIFLASVLAMVLEPVMEDIGVIAFSSKWKHIYSFFGYAAFLLLIQSIHDWVRRIDN
nr:CBO0543 family protein [Halobacillus karajensis]